MKYWMLAAICSGFCVTANVTAGMNTELNEGSSVLAEQVFRDGLAFCNQASKLSRTDAPAARTHIAQYLHHLERAEDIAPEAIKHNGFIQREAKRCTLVEDNIARLEAMTLAETSLQRCADARNALDNGALSQAQIQFDQYQAMSQQAVAVTPTVMRVGSLGVQFRRCDQLVEKISLARVNRARVARETKRTLTSFEKVLDTCAAGEQLLRGRATLDDKVQAGKQILRQLQNQLQLADQQAAELVKSAVASGSPFSQQVTDIQTSVATCQQNLVAQVNQTLQWAEQRPSQQEQATAMLKTAPDEAATELPSPYAALPGGSNEMTVEGGVVQLGTPEF